MKLIYDEKLLRNKNKIIHKKDELYINIVIKNMINIMYKNGGKGIAGCQIGYNKKIFIIKYSKDKIKIFINPDIILKEELIENIEGCLSFKNIKGNVLRYNKIKIKYYNGINYVEEFFTGKNAIAIQHEFDHCNGILFIDKIINNMIFKKSLYNVIIKYTYLKINFLFHKFFIKNFNHIKINFDNL